jgi:hypothetical protein
MSFWKVSGTWGGSTEQAARTANMASGAKRILILRMAEIIKDDPWGAR